MKDKELNEKESLELIARMIRNTRRNLDTGSGNSFLVWGYVGVLVTLPYGQVSRLRVILSGCGDSGGFRLWGIC